MYVAHFYEICTIMGWLALTTNRFFFRVGLDKVWASQGYRTSQEMEELNLE